MSAKETAVRLEGAPVAAVIGNSLRQRIAALGPDVPCLALVTVGLMDGGTASYIRRKMEYAARLGIQAQHVEIPGDLDSTAVEARVRSAANDPSVHAVVIQLPLPEHLDPRQLANLVPVAKDVDGLGDASLGRLVAGSPMHVAPTPLGVLRLLDYYGIPTSGRHAVVVGRSTLVGRPLALALLLRGVDATVTVCHAQTVGMAEITRRADLVISAAGVPGLIDSSCVRSDAVVIDVGLTRTSEGLRGDVIASQVGAIASAVSPVPGGIGPLTVACLMENVTRAAELAADPASISTQNVWEVEKWKI